ncbi:SMC family ATPase [Vibrio kyushuensis]|uniref:AAA family ATPase n=1 Tax=Vibrio kyushuensis TaxID=2910249 RepID=UPI003D103304
MQPITITLQAFGPFARKQCIDFTSMGNAPLFLINGPTGSGKSSILDAICYALYGETTGSERTGDQMRCDYADIELLTEVTFEFKLFDRIYKVVRSPDQEVPKKRGDGTTKRTHSATLYELVEGEEKLLANKPTPVLKEIRDLLGLDVKQFRQVMVLPQGKFRELLTATSKEREQIFGQLFQTHIYSAIERALFERAAGIRKAKDEFDNQTKGVLDVANVEDESQLALSLKENGNSLDLAIEKMTQSSIELEQAQLQEKSAKELADRFTQLAQKKIQLQELLSGEVNVNQKRVYRSNAASAQTLDVPYSQLVVGKKDLAEKTSEHVQASAMITTAKQNLLVVDAKLKLAIEDLAASPELQSQIFNLESVRTKLLERTQFEQRLLQAQRHCSQAEGNRDNLQTALVQLEADLETKRSQLDQAKQCQQRIPIVQQQYNGFLEQLELEKKKRVLQEKHNIQKEQRLNAVNKLAVAKEQTAVAIAYADNLEYQWHSSQAAQLAKQLHMGEACPVCGSCEHPEPARFSAEEVTKHNVDVARAHQQEIVNIELKATDTLAESDKEFALTQQAISTLDEQLLSKESLSIEQIGQQVKRLEQEMAELIKTTPEQIETALQQVSQKLADAKNNLNKQLEAVSNAKVLIAREQTEVDSRTSDIPEELKDLSRVESQLLQKRTLLEQITKNEQSTRSEYDQYNQMYISSQARVEELNKQLSQAKVQVDEVTQKWQIKLEESPFSDESSYLSSCLSKTDIDELEQAINLFEQLKTTVLAEVATLEEGVVGLKMPECEKLSELRQVAEASHAEILNQYTQLKSVQDRYIEVQKKLEILVKQNEELNQEYRIVGTLSDVANGKTGSKISLHRFVLGVLLDDVLIQASLRLRKMSKGRYELKRKEQRAKGNVGSGLDLMVEDGYTSKLRDVATLSGGESFMAALALALGLSDVVQSYSGGIRLDTLFIDEGFGSLDPESLDLAIETLIDLQLGGRTIGIISHVSELKEQMSLRIDVEPSREGSSIEVIS